MLADIALSEISATLGTSCIAKTAEIKINSSALECVKFFTFKIIQNLTLL